MELKTMRGTLNRKKFKCTVYGKDGTWLASRIYTAYGEEGALMQLEEWIEVNVGDDYDPNKIKIEPV
ncbi:hypothetical protein [Larkinella rosea]|uniref:Uncharacterized protein n=1 Tax=Larkinella rosea TaxID=2025312 RepID=A0A3P1C2T2_9BACT|nr:hypothetical protein [Larkinella rosea]RRB07114.1 hypothetical protein EHT25_04845 [Larkinella rosea]